MFEDSLLRKRKRFEAQRQQSDEKSVRFESLANSKPTEFKYILYKYIVFSNSEASIILEVECFYLELVVQQLNLRLTTKETLSDKVLNVKA